jgi:plastocyanin
MWSGGIALWMTVVWMAWVVRVRPLVAGGVVLILIAVIGTSTAGVWGRQTPWGALSNPPWITAPFPGDQNVRLRMVDFAFRPSVIPAPPGVPLTLELINSGTTVHTVVIPVLGVRATVLPGDRRTVGVGRVAAGTYEFFCAIPAHREAGMMGRLVVGPEN